MIQQCKDPEFLRDHLLVYEDYFSPDFDFEEYLEHDNVVLQEGDSVGLFTYEYPGVYSGHYFFTVRGREALKLAQEMLSEIFRSYGARTIRGLTPVEHKAALWMSRKLGFTSYGQVEIDGGRHELFLMTMDEFYHHNLQKDTH